jgi:hypothetical protein
VCSESSVNVGAFVLLQSEATSLVQQVSGPAGTSGGGHSGGPGSE